MVAQTAKRRVGYPLHDALVEDAPHFGFIFGFKVANENLFSSRKRLFPLKCAARCVRCPHLRRGSNQRIVLVPGYGVGVVRNDFSLANHFWRRTMHATGRANTTPGEKQKQRGGGRRRRNVGWCGDDVGVMDARKDQMWCRCNPERPHDQRDAGASQAHFIAPVHRRIHVPAGWEWSPPNLPHHHHPQPPLTNPPMEAKSSEQHRSSDGGGQKRGEQIQLWKGKYAAEIPHVCVLGEGELYHALGCAQYIMYCNIMKY